MACTACQSDDRARRLRCIMHHPASLGSRHAKGMRSHLFAEGGKPGATEAAGRQCCAPNGLHATRVPLSNALAGPCANLCRAPVSERRPRFTGMTADRPKAAGTSPRRARSACCGHHKAHRLEIKPVRILMEREYADKADIIGWLSATIWAVYALQRIYGDRKIERALARNAGGIAPPVHGSHGAQVRHRPDHF